MMKGKDDRGLRKMPVMGMMYGGEAKKKKMGYKKGGAAKKGLWHNIRMRRKAGKTMRKKGDPGAPTEEAIRNSQK